MLDLSRLKVTHIKTNRVNTKYTGTYTTDSGRQVPFNIYYHRVEKSVLFNPRLSSTILEDLISEELLQLL